MKPHLNQQQIDELAHEWVPDRDGILRRSAARVVLFASDGTTFLIRGHDFGDSNHWWWFTVGGGIAPSETPREGVLRELHEETGLVVTSDRLIGPVLERHAEFHFALENRRQDELFYILHVTDAERACIGHGRHFTALEAELLDEWRWWALEDIPRAEREGAVFYPKHFPELAALWREDWDGKLLQITEYEDDTQAARQRVE